MIERGLHLMETNVSPSVIQPINFCEVKLISVIRHHSINSLVHSERVIT